VFLDRHKWLKNSWPMVANHFRDTLADRLSKVRGDYIHSLIEDCGHATGMSRDIIAGMQAKWSLASSGTKYRFAQHVVEVLHKGLVYDPGKAEQFDPDFVEKNAEDVVKNYRHIMR
jgi:hypothetical protein